MINFTLHKRQDCFTKLANYFNMPKNNPQITLRKLVRAFTTKTKPKILRVAGELIVNESLQNFKNESYEGKKWKKREGEEEQDRKKRRALLVKSGRLRRSVRVVKIEGKRVIVGSDVPYAQRHNEGLKNMPQRKFLGFSERLKKKIRQTILDNFI